MTDIVYMVVPIFILLAVRTAIISHVWGLAREQISAYNRRCIQRGEPCLQYPSEVVFNTFPRFLLACFDLRKWTRWQLFAYAAAAFTQ